MGFCSRTFPDPAAQMKHENMKSGWSWKTRSGKRVVRSDQNRPRIQTTLLRGFSLSEFHLIGSKLSVRNYIRHQPFVKRPGLLSSVLRNRRFEGNDLHTSNSSFRWNLGTMALENPANNTFITNLLFSYRLPRIVVCTRDHGVCDCCRRNVNGGAHGGSFDSGLVDL